VLRVTEALYAAMQDQGLSEADLARRLGVSRQYVNKFLAGRANISLRTLVRLAYALGLDIDITVGARVTGTVEQRQAAETGEKIARAA